MMDVTEARWSPVFMEHVAFGVDSLSSQTVASKCLIFA